MKNLNMNSKFLVGMEVRTKNSDEMSPHGKIPKLWEEFLKKNISEIIKEKTSENIYGVYSNYESDHTGEYDYFIGYEVNDIKPYSNNNKLIIKKIMPGKYLIVTTEKGPMQKVLFDAWVKIWNMKGSDLDGKRAFKTDFEIYPTQVSDPNNSVVDIYLGIVH